MSNKRLRAVLAQAGALVLGGAVFLVTPARGVEPAPAPDNSFTCRASAVRTENSTVTGLNVEPYAANEDGGVCDTDSAGLLGPTPFDLPGGLGQLEVLYAQTDGTAHTARAGAASAELTPLAGTTITAEVLTSQAGAGTCPSPALSGSSEVVNVAVNNINVAVPSTADASPEVAIPGVGALHLNYQTNDGTVLTQRALFLDVDPGLAGGAVPDIIVAESIADIHGDPCPQPIDEGRCPAPSPEGQDATPDKDCGFGKPSNVDDAPKGGRNK